MNNHPALNNWWLDKPRIYFKNGTWRCTALARSGAEHLQRDTPAKAYQAWQEYWDDIYRRLNASQT